MEPDRFSFADSVTGLEHAFHISLSLRSQGFSTRLVTTPITLAAGFPGLLHTVIATPQARLNRKERGCGLNI